MPKQEADETHSDDEDGDDLAARAERGDVSVAELAAMQQTLEAKVDQMVLTRVENNEDAVADLVETVEELSAEVEECRDRIGTLEQKLAGLAGLEEHEKSTPEKRREDLVLSLQRLAEDGAGVDDNGQASMTYKDVLDQWATLNHGRLAPAQAYRAMERVAEIDGITMTTNQEDQKVVRINLDRFDSLNAPGTVNDVHNDEGSHESQKAVQITD
jgi:TolA-binding protein